MTNKTIITCVSALGAVAVLSGCTTICGANYANKHRSNKPKTDPVVFYQTYEDADVNKVTAKMYTNSSNGGESKMGHIKFYETDSGLKMSVDLQDLRPNKTYHVKIYPCHESTNGTWSCNTSMNIDLPNLNISEPGRLEESYIIRGLTASQLKNAKIYLERDGGYKAAWGKLN